MKRISCGIFLVMLIDALQNIPKLRPELKLRKAVSNIQGDSRKSYWREKERFVYSEAGYKLYYDMFEREYFEAEIDRKRYGIYEHESRDNLVQERVDNVAGGRIKEERHGKISTYDSHNVFVRGNWIEVNGNYILRPSTDDNPPVGVIHFLGGAFVGAIPHLAYKNLLESLGNAGYLIVATPYRLEFDYAKTCDSILEKFDNVATELAKEYGPLPVVGIGHSCGALLQSLITSLFPSAPRAANVLISFNNKPAREAIPALEELIVPLSSILNNEYSRASPSPRDNFLDVGIMARTFEEKLDEFFPISLPISNVVGTELIPIFRESVKVMDQIPDVMNMIGKGEREFIPSPSDTKEVCRRMYRARSTLLLKFDDDSLDESEEIEEVLREANTIMRMKRPMIEMDVELKYLHGTHLTPLTQILSLDIPGELTIPILDSVVKNLLRDQILGNVTLNVHNAKNVIVDWLDVKLGRYCNLHKTTSGLNKNKS